MKLKIVLGLIGTYGLLCSQNNGDIPLQCIDKGYIQDILSFLGLSWGALESPYHASVARVRELTGLNTQEVQYTAQRMAFIEQVFKKYRGISVNKIPKIAVCISGGGVRALIGGLGFLQAMQEVGLLDITCYLCGLSGSCWAISGLLESQKRVVDYLEFLKSGLAIGLLNGIDGRSIIDELLKKIENEQSISLIDIWGVLIAKKVLLNQQKKNLTHITLSNYALMPADGSLAMPIYSCVVPIDAEDEQRYRWVEWTPFEIHCPYLKSGIPLWGLGRTFKGGKSIDKPAELSLSFAQGVWGSVMSGNIQDLLKIVINPLISCEEHLLKFILHHLQDGTFLDQISQLRAFPAELPNWNFQLEGKPASNNETITFVDAAFLCNLPLVPVLNPLREVDVIIAVDLTIGDDFVLELPCMATYAAHHGLPFPVIHKETLSNICSVYGLQDAVAPAIIYFPMVANPDYKNGWNPQTADFTGTLNVTYTPEQVDLVSGLMYTACKQHLSTIWQVIMKKTSMVQGHSE